MTRDQAADIIIKALHDRYDPDVFTDPTAAQAHVIAIALEALGLLKLVSGGSTDDRHLRRTLEPKP
jgi:hypothetical protein